MIKNFSQYLIESEREVYFTFGRMNPPTIGHGKVFDTLSKKSGQADYKIYVSQSQNPKKDPLSYSEKVKHLRKMFPKHARSIMMDTDVRNVFDVAVKLYDQGYRKINMVVGEDRIREFETLLGKYNGTKARHGFYNFESINIVSAGRRDPDAEGVEGMSASKQRANAQNNDFVAFSQGVPSTMSDRDARKLFNDVRKGMGLKEQTSFRNHIELAPVSETREAYVHGELFDVGDLVAVKESEEVGIVSHLGANYVIVEMTGDRRVRKWLDAVELVEKKFEPHMMYDPKTGKGYKAEKPEDHERMSKMGYTHEKPSMKEEEDDTTTPQDPDIDDRKGTQPKKYFKGLAKSTKAARDRHFKKGAKMDDDNPKAYKPAPGDATAKTKPSKFTKQFKDMFEEGGGAGDEGTDKLRRKYQKDTPHEPVTESKYDVVTDAIIRRIMNLKAKNNGKLRHGIEHIVFRVNQDTNSNLDNRKLYKMVIDKLELMGVDDSQVPRKSTIPRKKVRIFADTELKEQDPVQVARKRIEKDKENREREYEDLLARARLARARQKNREAETE